MPRDRRLLPTIRRAVRLGPSGRPHRRRIGLPRTLDEGAFLAVLSHELRTPVTTIYGGAQVLATHELTDERRRTLATDVGHEAERLYRIVEDLVALLGSERGDLQVTREPVALGRLIVAAIDHELARDPRPTIRFVGASDATVEEADQALLGHVVRNLLDNAIRFSAAGALIEVVVDVDGQEVTVRVLDQGPAPVDQVRRDAIDPAGTAAGLAGGGLGLFVAARLVQAMDGRSWASPRPGGGAEFGFALRQPPTLQPAGPGGALRG
jgi:two-component system sensor histidine kinase KdpD